MGSTLPAPFARRTGQGGGGGLAPLGRSLLVLGLLLTPVVPVLADGGAVCAHDTIGPWIVTIFVAPATVRAGPVDLSVMVQDGRDAAPLLDAEVTLDISPRDGGIPASSLAATHEQATNKLLYAVQFPLAAAGTWDVRAKVRRRGEAVETNCTFTAAEALPPVLAYWPYFALPPVAIALFALHQWLVGRR